MVSVAALLLVVLCLAGWECIPSRPMQNNGGIMILSKRQAPTKTRQQQPPFYCSAMESAVVMAFVVAFVVVLTSAFLTGVCWLCCLCQALSVKYSYWSRG